MTQLIDLFAFEPSSQSSAARLLAQADYLERKGLVWAANQYREHALAHRAHFSADLAAYGGTIDAALRRFNEFPEQAS